MPISADTLALRDYLARIPEEADRQLVEEAGKAAQAGALRLAYVGVWVACAESLKRRFQELSPFDGAATAIISDIARKEAAQQSIDAFVLNKAKEYGFLSDIEHTRLEHIYKMRCVYGHPYETAPSPEDLLSAASSVTELVLSRPVKLREGYITRQISSLITDATFLDDVEAAVASYASRVFARVDDALHGYLVQKLWQAANGFTGDPTMGLFSRRAIWFSRSYLATDGAVILSGWDTLGVLSTYREMATLVLTDTRLFPLLDVHAQDIVVGNLVEFSATWPKCLKGLEQLVRQGLTTERQEERFTEAVRAAGWDALAASGVPLAEWADRIIADLKSYNWYSQNPAADAISNAGPTGLDTLDEDRQRELGRNVLQAADGQARSAGSLLQRLADAPGDWPLTFIEGVVLECFADEQGLIRFKPKGAQTALPSLRKLTPRKRDQVLGQLAQVLTDGQLKKPEWSHDEERQKMLGTFDSLMTTDPAFGSQLQGIRDLVANLEIPDYE